MKSFEDMYYGNQNCSQAENCDLYDTDQSMNPYWNAMYSYGMENIPAKKAEAAANYGYDNSKDMEDDLLYFKCVYPPKVREIEKLVADECDKMEQDGSIMFDECPDKVQIGILTDRIYDTCGYGCEKPYCCTEENWLWNMIQVMLCQEMCDRRRKYRGRKRMF